MSLKGLLSFKILKEEGAIEADQSWQILGFHFSRKW